MSKVYADKDTPWRDAGILRELYVMLRKTRPRDTRGDE